MTDVNVIGIGQLRGYTRTYIERAEAGETFQVLRRGRPIARLQSAQDGRHALIPVALADLRTRPARVFDLIAAGETVLVTYRGRNVATLRPCDGGVTARPSRVPAVIRGR